MANNNADASDLRPNPQQHRHSGPTGAVAVLWRYASALGLGQRPAPPVSSPLPSAESASTVPALMSSLLVEPNANCSCITGTCI